MESDQFRVLADYEVLDPHPLRLPAGAEVRLIQVDTSWPGWVWVEADTQAGWIPESFLDTAPVGNPVVRRAFDGSDLSARRGEFLVAEEAAPGWIYARNAAGQQGWFPLFNLRPCP